MRAAILRTPKPVGENPLVIEDIPLPTRMPGEALLKVLACAVCRTDLHIVEGELELPQRQASVIPGHQIVAEVVESDDPEHPVGSRVGVSWIGGTDGTCRFCRSDRENLCDAPTYTGYTHPGGFAEYTTARTDFLYTLPESLDPVTAAPLLCAGMIGFRSLRIAEVKPGKKVGLFGFGASAQLLIQVLRAWGCPAYVATRGEHHRAMAKQLGATWVGDATDRPPEPLDAAITFAPAGDVVLSALKSLDKGGILAINAIHLDHFPTFDYDSILWGERQVRSVTNMTRQDGHDFLHEAAKIHLLPETETYRLEQINEAMQSQKNDTLNHTAVIVMDSALEQAHA